VVGEQWNPQILVLFWVETQTARHAATSARAHLTLSSTAADPPLQNKSNLFSPQRMRYQVSQAHETRDNFFYI
jgi:hypothetical protein